MMGKSNHLEMLPIITCASYVDAILEITIFPLLILRVLSLSDSLFMTI